MKSLAAVPAAVGRGNGGRDESARDRTPVRRGGLPVDRRTQRKIAHAMAKIAQGARLAREGHAELQSVFRAAKAEKRAPAPQGETSVVDPRQAAIDNSTSVAGLQ